MAIIAVLVAIAVPLFVGQLGDAEETVKDANKRTVRSEATIYLLQATPTAADATKPDELTKKGGAIFDVDGNFHEKIVVTAHVKSNGEIENLTFAEDKSSTEESCEKASDGGYNVTVVIDTKDALKPTAATGAGG